MINTQLATLLRLNKRFIVLQSVMLCMLLSLLISAYAKNASTVNNEFANLVNFRAIPAYLSQDNQKIFIRQSEQDKTGHIWIASSTDVKRYDGYTYETFELPLEQNVSNHTNNGDVFITTDREKNIWVGAQGLYRFDYDVQDLVRVDIGYSEKVNGLIEDSDGLLWFIDTGKGLSSFNADSMQVVDVFDLTTLGLTSNLVHGLAYEASQHALWMVADDGLIRFDIATHTLDIIPTPLSKLFRVVIIRDIAIDESRSQLWLGTPEGLLQLDTKSFKHTIHSVEKGAKGLPTSDVTTMYVDEKFNVWVGLEKQGLCVFVHEQVEFVCHKSAIDKHGRLPFATIEDISEGSDGSLWVSSNHYGIFRISPHLEIFERLSDKINLSESDIFPHTFDGVARENGDIWFATDGGGINIFNHINGDFENLKHDPLDSSTLSSNAIISIAEDPSGMIWTGAWAGGINRVNPQTLSVERFKHNPSLAADKTLAGNNVFFVLPDKQHGLWLSVWGFGLQYFDYKTNTFTNFIHKVRGGKANINNTEITHLQLFENKLFIAGQSSLEYLDLSTMRFHSLFRLETDRLYYVLVESMEQIWIATTNGLIKYNAISDTSQRYTQEDGLSDNAINYLYRDEFKRLWIATEKGLSILYLDTNKVISFFERDGLVSDALSTHGEITRVGNSLYIPNKRGVNIVDINDIRINTMPPSTQVTKVEVTEQEGLNNKIFNPTQSIPNKNVPALNHDLNNVKFYFTALSFVHPQYNKFKYRLTGWQREFTYIGANERFVKFDNLPPGEYTFELYSANSSNVWDSKGDTFSFSILQPWWRTWWAALLLISLFVLSIYGFTKWRISLLASREKALTLKVEEKTQQLNEYASELKYTSDSLAKLNTELEQRVSQRTEELQVEINERKVAETKLFHLAFHDALTGLPNREWLIKRLNSLISKNRNGQFVPFALLFLDGDRFKQINDTHGHNVGDELLIASAMRLSKLLSDNQYAARLGGDEFTVVAENIHKPSDLETLGEKIINAFKRPFELDKLTIHFQMSVGLVHVDKSYTAVTGALRDADIAMYNAKQDGKGKFKIFDKEMRKVTLELSELEADLRNAVSNEEFYVVYQPLLDLNTNKVSGCEALIRWEHPTRGNIRPDIFIPMAEETGLIVEIGKWVLKTACEQLRQWQLFECLDQLTVSVNLSSNQLKGDEFLGILDEILYRSGLEGKYLKLELTESALIENTEHIKHLLDEIITRDVELAIDDFGTGYSSLAYLHQLPVQHIKIDRSFIDAIDNTPSGNINEDALEVVRATVALGQSLRMKVTAEGIESLAQLNALKALGTDFSQGYYIAKPLPAEDLVSFVKKPLQFDDTQAPPTPLQKYKDNIANKALRLKKGGIDKS